MEQLSPADLASLCAWRRQQLYERCNAAAGRHSSDPPFHPADPAFDDKFRLLSWARDRGWVDPHARHSPDPAAATANDILAQHDRQVEAAAAGAAEAGAAASRAGHGKAAEGMASVVATLRSAVVGRRVGGRRRGEGDEPLGPAAAEVHQVESLEWRLEQQLMAGGMARPTLPTARHPLHRLPPELVLRVLQLAAYPLSAWAEQADFTAADAPPGAAAGQAAAAAAPLVGDLLSDSDDSSSEEGGSSEEEEEWQLLGMPPAF